MNNGSVQESHGTLAGAVEKPEPARASRQEAPASPVPAPRTRRREFRPDLLFLIGAVLAVNVPLLAGRYMPEHDTKYVLGIFDYFYANHFFTGELPRWMAYGVFGLDASAYHIHFMSAASYLVAFAGRWAGMRDSLLAFGCVVCLEQLFLLLGMWLLCRRLFRGRLTVFCVCLFTVCTVVWQSQVFFNFRMYDLLPLEFYLLIRFADDAEGWCGWLAGIVAILGPLGCPPYFYPMWGFIIAVFSAVALWGRYGSLRELVRARPMNLAVAAMFAILLLAFAGNLWQASANFVLLAPGRDAATGSIPLPEFLQHGRIDLPEMWRELLIPTANMAGASETRGMNDYLGLICLIGLPIALSRIGCRQARPFAVLATVLLFLSFGGVFACVVYWFPGMDLYRHIGYLTGIIKLLVVVLSGFGLDALIAAVEGGSLKSYASPRVLLGALLGILAYVDLNMGGVGLAGVCEALGRKSGNWAGMVFGGAMDPVLRAALMLALVFAVWTLSRTGRAGYQRSARFALYAIAVCVIGDCVLFQVELISALRPASHRIAFPALKPVYFPDRDGRIAGDAGPKYKAWAGASGVEYQTGISGALQWDPSMPNIYGALGWQRPMLKTTNSLADENTMKLMKVDWFPLNVFHLMRAMEPSSDTGFMAICGVNQPKMRLVPEAVSVPTDADAYRLAASTNAWSDKVVVTAPLAKIPSGGSLARGRQGSAVRVDDFSANQISITVSNGFARPAWLVYADAWTPDWHATVNGKATPVLRGYGAFKTVQVQPGINHVRLWFDAGIRTICQNVLAVCAAAAAAAGLGCLLWLALAECFGRTGGNSENQHAVAGSI
jgi:hypothetical protein